VRSVASVFRLLHNPLGFFLSRTKSSESNCYY
jgi:hypothetical protein